MAKSVVVLGTQWGDEGKGKIVDLLTDQASVAVRFQGGHNAGHTLVINGEKTMPVLKHVVEGLKTRLPHAQVVEVESASHMVPLTHSKEVAKHLQATWAR